MDDSEVSPLKNFDENLQQFYYEVIGKEVNLTIMWKVHSTRRALIEMKAHEKRFRRKSDIRFDTPYRRCAYLLMHGPCFTSAVAKYFHRLMNNRQYLIENAFKSGNLAICCLGGGPATEAVALVHVIRYLYEPYWIKCRKTLEINITVVDISEGWQDTAKNVLDCLKMDPEFFGKGELALTYEFLAADLTEEMSQQLKTIMRSADIVTMIYFLSAVSGTRGRKTSENMVENIMLGLKKEAFVFCLDSAVDKHYEILNKASEKRNVMVQIYGPLVEEFHTISIESVETFLDLYIKHFHKLMCATYMFFCVSSWRKLKIKTVKKILYREYLSETPPSWKKPTYEESDDLARKMKQHRSTVFRLVNKRYNTTFNVKSNNEFRREMFWGKKGFEKQKVDPKNISDFASCRNFRKISLEIQKSHSSNNYDLACFRNFAKTGFTNNSDFASSKNFGKTGSTGKSDFANSRNFLKTGSNNSDFSSFRNFGKPDSNNSDFANFRKVSKIGSTNNSDFANSKNVRKIGSANNSDCTSSRNLGKTGSNKSDFANSRNFGKTGSNKNDFANSRKFGKTGSTNDSDFASSRNFGKTGSTNDSDFASFRNFGKTGSTNDSDFVKSRNFGKTGTINKSYFASSRNKSNYDFEK